MTPIDFFTPNTRAYMPVFMLFNNYKNIFYISM